MRRLLVLAVAPLVAVSGCGVTGPLGAPGGEPPAAGTDPLAAAVASTVSAGTARTSVTLRLGTGGGSMDVTGQGVVDVARRASRLVLALPAELASGPVELVGVDGRLWLRGPETGGRYVDVAGPLGGQALALVEGADTLGRLGALGEAEQVRVVGVGDVRGVPTTRYEATLSTGRLVGQLLGTAAPGEHDGLSVVADVDADGRLRRVAPVLAGADVPVSATVEFHDFGTPVDVRPPAPDQVDEEFLDGVHDEALELLGDGDGEAARLPGLGEVLDGLAVLADELAR